MRPMPGIKRKKAVKTPNPTWSKISYVIEVVTVFSLVEAVLFFAQVSPLVSIFYFLTVIYLKVLRGKRRLDMRSFVSLSLLFLIYIPICRFIISSGWSPYYVPVPAAAMVVMLNYRDLELVFVFAMLVSFLTAEMFGGNLYYFWIVFLSSIVGALMSQNVRHRKHIFRAGVGVSVTMVLLYLLYVYASGGNIVKANLIASLVNGIVSFSITFVGIPLFEAMFGTITNISLLEWADTQQPLLRKLVMEAPGTYHHSLVVGNLAEAAAEEIGANSLLARVGAYYHDIGKIPRAEYFVENQPHGQNTHEKLSPSMSKLILLNHVKEGLELARKHRLPRQIMDFIAQHHGKSLTYYFYQKALEEGKEDIREEDFRYPGPKPQSKETAIVLLADAVEAAVRSLPDPTPDKIKLTVKKVIDSKVIDGQLDECDLTFRDLDRIARVFTKILTSMYHQRVAYPEPKGKNGKNPKNGKNGRNAST